MKPIDVKFGVLLPHFGPHATRERLVGGAQQIESYGFDSVWVRDHVVFNPHSYEDPDRTHVDPFVVLSAIASVTSQITLGTATLIPHRHPIHAALALGSLDFVAGPRRIIAGFGLGAGGHEFESIGMGDWDRVALMQEQVEILRALWQGSAVSHHGRYYNFDDVQIRPVPADGGLPIWYGGNSLAAARRSVEFCDGWLPARMPRFAFRRRMKRIAEVMAKTGRPEPVVGMIPYVVPAETEAAAARRINTDEFYAMSMKNFGAPPGKEGYDNVRDLDGGAIAGPPAVIAEEVHRYLDEGVKHFVFDLRLNFDIWEDSLRVIGEEVLPLLKARHGR